MTQNRWPSFILISSPEMEESNACANIHRCFCPSPKEDSSFPLTEAFFQNIVGSKGTVVSWCPFEVPLQTISLTATCKAAQANRGITGHYGFDIKYRPHHGETETKKLRVVAKCKPLANKFVKIFAEWIRRQPGDVSKYADVFQRVSYFKYSDVREIKLLSLSNHKFTDIAPQVYHTICDPSKELFIAVMEDLTGRVTHFNAIDNAPEVWNQEDIQVVLRDIAGFHSIHLGDVTHLKSEPWMCVYSSSVMQALRGFWLALLSQNRANFPIHYDFTPRNVCLRKHNLHEDNQRSVFISNNNLCRVSCIYDWEMATIHAPQHDVVEFLAFVLPAKTDVTTRIKLVRFYQRQLERFSGKTFDSAQFMDVFNAVSCVYALHQLSLKTITHSVMRLPYFERAFQSHMGYLEDLATRNSLAFLNDDPTL
ncbi:hypothetical protein P5673_012975 [Acropora cervicornis]|uniref:Aminoglycoside phosphotransferase domain-containing protein n=1 Tax=Acropora cervicornis TaxID=6130 RepID=A0AAD9V7A3_ACRCE|nr:hypothetical protein P5673_012975 [Acropora cervicornis]